MVVLLVFLLLVFSFWWFLYFFCFFRVLQWHEFYIFLFFFIWHVNAWSAGPSLNPLTSGPYGLIFASYIPFFFDIPITTKFRIFGLRLSDKSFIYLSGLQVNSNFHDNFYPRLISSPVPLSCSLCIFDFQLLFSSGWRSIIPGLSGILAGLLYRLNIFGIRRLKVN